MLLEGKSDYFILSYFSRWLGIERLPIIPGLGANTLANLVSLLRGWNMNFYVLLDGDKEGVKARKQYQEKLLLDDREIGLLSELVPGTKEAEDLLGKQELNHISKQFELKDKPNKKQILAYFQEAQFSEPDLPTSNATRKKFEALFDALNEKFQTIRNTS